MKDSMTYTTKGKDQSVNQKSETKVQKSNFICITCGKGFFCTHEAIRHCEEEHKHNER